MLSAEATSCKIHHARKKGCAKINHPKRQMRPCVHSAKCIHACILSTPTFSLLNTTARSSYPSPQSSTDMPNTIPMTSSEALLPTTQLPQCYCAHHTLKARHTIAFVSVFGILGAAASSLTHRCAQQSCEEGPHPPCMLQPKC